MIRLRERLQTRQLKEEYQFVQFKGSDLLGKIPQNMLLPNIKPKPNQGFLSRLIFVFEFRDRKMTARFRSFISAAQIRNRVIC